MEENSGDLIQLAYCSIADPEPDREDLERLLDTARRRNAEVGITGMLLYAAGSFFQVIEGEEHAIDQLFRMIRGDRRHTNVTVILREPVPTRSFQRWSMGHADITEAEAAGLMGTGEFTRDSGEVPLLDRDRARKLLDAFREGRWRGRIRSGIPAGFPRRTFEPSGAFSKAYAGRPRKEDGYTYAFQPIVRPRDGSIYSYEALLRGDGDGPACEVLQSVPSSELHAFDQSSRLHAIQWAAHLGLSTRLNLNVMPSVFLDRTSFTETLLEAIQLAGIQPEQVVLEILENDVIDDLEGLSNVLREYRSTGLRFAIDDFGSGYAGLNLLAEFQPDLLKLDLQLVRGIEGDGPRQAIVRGVARTCLDLGIEVIAEGVETEEEYLWLRDDGIDLYQGYLFAKPVLEELPVSFHGPS